MSKPVIVIVPGAWHRAKHYQHINDGLEKSGYEAIGITLPTLDSRPPNAVWDQDAETVRQLILKNLDSGKDVIVIAHSFGGVAMSEAVKGLGKKAREEQGLKGGVVRLIYMCAMALPKGQSHIGQMSLGQEEPQQPIPVEEDGVMILDREAARFVLYNGCDPKDADEALELLGSHPVSTLSVPVTYTAYLEIPSTYIICENDNALPLAAQETMIAQGEGAFDVERCKEGHSPFISNPGFIVDCIRRAAGESV